MKWLSAVLLSLSLMACSEDSSLSQAERQFQEDADLVRLNDLAYWSGLIEKYQQKTGHYPFQDKLKDKYILVYIATKSQYPLTTQLFVNGGRFDEKSMKAFVAVLSSSLTQSIDEHYDIQKIPTHAPVGYFYFATSDGYLLWTTCVTCGTTPISTLLTNGTPTVNIASPNMLEKVFKSKTREEMLAHPLYKKWISRPFHKKAYIQQLIEENLHESQQ